MGQRTTVLAGGPWCRGILTVTVIILAGSGDHGGRRNDRSQKLSNPGGDMGHRSEKICMLLRRLSAAGAPNFLRIEQEIY